MRRSVRPSRLLLSLFALSAAPAAHAQESSQPPIPLEVVAVHRYASTNMVVTRDLGGGTPFGFFHLNTVVMDYDGGADLALQNVLYYEPLAGYRLIGGMFYASEPGLSPTVGAQMIKAGQGGFLLLSPRVNVQADPSYSVFAIARYGVGNPPGLGPYLSVQALTTFDGAGHIKSYQWLRLGLETRRNQFGVALNFDESGPDAEVEVSVGVFVRREVF